MSEPFLAEIRLVGFNFAPRGWAFCDGQLLPIAQNQAVFSLLGTMYGGDGRTSFGLPDMRGRAPVHAGTGEGLAEIKLGQKGGAESIALTANEIPEHTHARSASRDKATEREPRPSAVNAHSRGKLVSWSSQAAKQSMAETSVQLTGGGQSHNNMQPFLVVHFCIALMGLFPSRN